MMLRGERASGFTFIELLIVIVILGILSAVTIPQFQDNSAETRLTQLKANLKVMRDAIELYHAQHDSHYPGMLKPDGSGQYSSGVSQAETAFEEQLLLYTDRNGGSSVVRTAAHKYGPYLKRGIPVNPFNGSKEVRVNIRNDEIDPQEADNSTGWIFYIHTGVFYANDEEHKMY